MTTKKIPSSPVIEAARHPVRGIVSRMESFFGGWTRHGGEEPSWAPPVDIRETRKAYILTAELPGLAEDDVSITLEDEILTVSGERRFDASSGELHHVERGYGHFRRVFHLPARVAPEEVRADVRDGLLTITVPRPAGAPPMQVHVEGRPGSVPLTPTEQRLLADGGFDLRPRDGRRDPIAETAARYEGLLRTSLSTAEAGARLGVDPSRIRQRLAERTLYGIRPQSQWVLPAFQFLEKGEVPGWSAVAPRLRTGLHPVAVQCWFLEPNVDLVDPETDKRLSPRNWLRAGFPPEAAARSAAEL